MDKQDEGCDWENIPPTSAVPILAAYYSILHLRLNHWFMVFMESYGLPDQGESREHLLSAVEINI